MPDNAIPTNVTVGPNGEVLYEFEGKIHADGLTLPERDLIEGSNSIEWLENEEKLREIISGYRFAGGHKLQLDSRSPSEIFGTILARLELFAQSNFAKIVASIPGFISATILDIEGQSDFVQLAGEPPLAVELGLKAGLTTLLNSSNQSQFMQLASLANRKINFNSAEAEWPGAANASKEFTVSHGLGVSPVAVLITPSTGVGAFGNVGALSTTTFKGVLQDPFGAPAVGTKNKFYWTAIG